MVSPTEAVMEMVLPLLVTDVMQMLEDRGEHPQEDFTERFRVALLKIVPDYPTLEADIWNPEKKKKIVERLCELIEL